MPLTPGVVIHNNRYRIAKLLGQGGMGAVYRGWDLSLGKACAIKENLDPSPEAARQFFREAQMLSNLTHPYLPRVTDYFSIPHKKLKPDVKFNKKHYLCFKIASPNFFVICMPDFSRNCVGSSPPAKM